jgi:formate dehydrogenase gamma subunit
MGGADHQGTEATASRGRVPPNTVGSGAREVVRFSATERAFHWSFAIPFLGLLLSGLPLSFPALRSWITGYSAEIGLRLHLASAVAWLVAPPLVVIFGDRRALANAAAALFVVARGELSWLCRLPRWLVGLACDMSGVGRFNAGQKLNGWLIAVTSLVFAVTGVVLWAEWQTPGLFGRGARLAMAMLAWSRWLHFVLSVVILVPLLGHLVLATVHPRTRESLRGMLFGTVDAAWASDHHPAWYAEIRRAPSAAAGEGGIPSPAGVSSSSSGSHDPSARDRPRRRQHSDHASG